MRRSRVLTPRSHRNISISAFRSANVLASAIVHCLSCIYTAWLATTNRQRTSYLRSDQLSSFRDPHSLLFTQLYRSHRSIRRSLAHSVESFRSIRSSTSYSSIVDYLQSPLVFPFAVAARGFRLRLFHIHTPTYIVPIHCFPRSLSVRCLPESFAQSDRPPALFAPLLVLGFLG